MKLNTPVTDKEVLMKKGEILVSRTDLKGCITYVNDAFVAISGFTRNELIGSSHNIIRHPDMPTAVFEDLWEMLKQGKPWTALVKNRTKSGNFYWVETAVLPVYQNGVLHEYLSARYAPSREQIVNAESLYGKLNANTAKLRPTGIAATVKAVSETAISKKIALGLTVLLMLIGISMHQMFLAQEYLLLTVTSLLTIVGAAIIISVAHDVINTVETCIYTLYCMAGGKFKNKIELNRNDQLGDLSRGLYVMQVMLNSQLAESRQMTADALRINRALDNVHSGVVVADSTFNIIYTNYAVQRLFKKAEADIRQQLPDFNADQLMGANIDFFHKNPAHQRDMLEKLTHSFRSELIIGGHNMVVIANPVFSEGGERIGFVAEWLDRSIEVAVEQEVAALVQGAVMGDFTRRIEIQGKEGFFKQLGEALNELVETSETGLNEVVRVLNALSRGDLTEKITNNYSGTFGHLKDDSNTTVEKLKEIINQIKEATDNINMGAKEIASGNNDLSHRTEEQAASLEQTAASMEQLTSTVQHNAANAKQANQLAVDASDIAGKGVVVIGQVVKTMDDINDSSRKIGDIISVIDDIAFQTNILALNAAVEAARAGDQGRGFAVVAVEVRNLAQRAATAAAEIKQLIDNSVSKVSEGSKLVGQAGQTMKEIVSSIGGVTVMMSEISAASDEQTAGIQQVNQAIGQMDDVTQQNAALVEQAAAASESLEEQTQSLSGTVAQFKVDGHSHNARGGMSQAKSVSSFHAEPQQQKETMQARAGATINSAAVKPKPKLIPKPASDDWEEF
jgi:methyl-accepting chemotaxis protein